jgi:hypothetical protein
VTLTALLSGGNLIWSPSSVMVPRRVLEAVGGFNPALRRCADYDLYLRIAQHTPGRQTAEPLARYHRHAGSMSATIGPTLHAVMGVVRGWRRHADAAVRRAAVDGMRYYARWAYSQAGDLWEQRRHAEAFDLLRLALAGDPGVAMRAPWGRRHPLLRAARSYAWLAVAGLKARRAGRGATAQGQERAHAEAVAS